VRGWLSERHVVPAPRLRDVTLTMATDDAVWTAGASKKATYWMLASRMPIKMKQHALSEQRAATPIGIYVENTYAAHLIRFLVEIS